MSLSKLIYPFGVVELKYETGKFVIVKTEWIIGLKPKYNKTQDFLCYWSPDFNDCPELKECVYSEKFTGLPSLFKVFVIRLTNTIEEAQKLLESEGRVRMVAKRFREPGDTEEEISKIETKKKRNAKKELTEQKAEAHSKNSEYLFSNMSILSSNNTDKIEETEETQFEFSSVSTSISYNQDPIELLLTGLSDESINNIIYDNSQIDDSDRTVALESVKATEVDTATQHSDEPSTSVINYGLSKNNNSESNERPDVLSSIDLSSCSSYEEYVETLMNGHNQLNFNKEDLSNIQKEVDEIEENKNEDELVVINVPHESVFMTDVGRSNNYDSEAIIVDNISTVMIGEGSVVTMNFDDLKNENQELKRENETLKKDLEIANRRNILLQDYLVAADERLGQTLFIEKDEGRLYRGGVFLNKNQCAVLDKSKNDREFLNNLVTSIFGRNVLETSSITGAPSNRFKGKNVADSSLNAIVVASNATPKQKLKLDPELLQLTYDIMDARSVMNKTTKLTKTAKNAIIGKKCTNAATAADIVAAKTKP